MIPIAISAYVRVGALMMHMAIQLHYVGALLPLSRTARAEIAAYPVGGIGFGRVQRVMRVTALSVHSMCVSVCSGKVGNT